MIITNSYIIHQDQKLKDQALSEGLHKLLGFDGPIMTDSALFSSPFMVPLMSNLWRY